MGTRRPVPTHTGRATSQAGSRSPHGQQNAIANRMATAASATVAALIVRQLASRICSVGRKSPKVQEILISRYGVTAMAAK